MCQETPASRCGCGSHTGRGVGSSTWLSGEARLCALPLLVYRLAVCESGTPHVLASVSPLPAPHLERRGPSQREGQADVDHLGRGARQRPGEERVAGCRASGTCARRVWWGPGLRHARCWPSRQGVPSSSSHRALGRLPHLLTAPEALLLAYLATGTVGSVLTSEESTTNSSRRLAGAPDAAGSTPMSAPYTISILSPAATFSDTVVVRGDHLAGGSEGQDIRNRRTWGGRALEAGGCGRSNLRHPNAFARTAPRPRPRLPQGPPHPSRRHAMTNHPRRTPRTPLQTAHPVHWFWMRRVSVQDRATRVRAGRQLRWAPAGPKARRIGAGCDGLAYPIGTRPVGCRTQQPARTTSPAA